MTITPLAPTGLDSVLVNEHAITIEHLTVPHPEAAVLAAGYLQRGGPAAVEDAIRRAVPVGLVALSLTSSSLDSGALQRTLDGFAADVDARSRQALTGLDAVLSGLKQGEAAVAEAAHQALALLPEHLDRVLAGEAANVREAVTAAAQQVHTATLEEMRRALATHSQSVQHALSLDREGPVQTLRRDLLAQLDSTRQELGTHLTGVRDLLTAAQAGKAAATKSSRAVGDAFETEAMALAERIVTAAGDRWETVGSQPAPGTTSRAGDGLATLTSAITGRTQLSIVVEAKHRSTRPLTVTAWRDALTQARSVRGAAGALALVPTVEQMPGGRASFCRVDDLAFVAVADSQHAELVYLVLRELVALVSVRHQDGIEIDLARAEAQITTALSALTEFDEVGRLAGAAMKNLTALKDVGGRARTRIHDALTGGLAALNP